MLDTNIELIYIALIAYYIFVELFFDKVFSII